MTVEEFIDGDSEEQSKADTLETAKIRASFIDSTDAFTYNEDELVHEPFFDPQIIDNPSDAGDIFQNIDLDDIAEGCCLICSEENGTIEHHVSYYNPEVTIPVCDSCHGSIHSSRQYAYLEPPLSGRFNLDEKHTQMLTEIFIEMNRNSDTYGMGKDDLRMKKRFVRKAVIQVAHEYLIGSDSFSYGQSRAAKRLVKYDNDVEYNKQPSYSD